MNKLRFLLPVMAVGLSLAFAGCGAEEEDILAGSSALTIKGTVAIGRTVSAELTNGADASSFSYQWILLDTDNAQTNIANAKSAKYTIPSDEALIGQKLKVQAAKDGIVLNSAAKVISGATKDSPDYGPDGIPGTWDDPNGPDGIPGTEDDPPDPNGPDGKPGTGDEPWGPDGKPGTEDDLLPRPSPPVGPDGKPGTGDEPWGPDEIPGTDDDAPPYGPDGKPGTPDDPWGPDKRPGTGDEPATTPQPGDDGGEDEDDEDYESGYTVVNPTSDNLAIKFGIIESGNPSSAQEVTWTFQVIHNYVSGRQFDKTIKDDSDVIKLGDYIDLPQLVVAGDRENYGAINKTNVRLIVVGINSFNGINGNDKSHVVFHFKDSPGTYDMNYTRTNTTGYLDCLMRTYIINNFLPGLKTAGVPAPLLWAPSRIVASRGDGTPIAQTITDELWLPTEREMIGSNGDPASYTSSVRNIETADNQANFTGYYKDAERLSKYGSYNNSYWLASPQSGTSSEFLYMSRTGYYTHSTSADDARLGCVPAFCVW